MIKTKNIGIAITDLAPLCQMDHYNNFAKVMCKLWKSLDTISYDKYKKLCYQEGNYVANDSMNQKMLVLNNKLNNNIEILKEVRTINKNKNSTEELNKKQKQLCDKLEADIKLKAANVKSKKEKTALLQQAEELQKIVKSATNVVYGSKNEVSGYDYFTTLNPEYEIKKRQCYMTYPLISIPVSNKNCNKIKWQLKGIADGELTNGDLLEIKNRQKKLFGVVRDYEMCQIQSYMHILKSKKCHLIELITKNKKLQGNIIPIDYDDCYFDKIVSPNIELVIDFMTLLFNKKSNFTDDEKDTICMELIRGDPNKFVYNMIYS